MAEKKKEIAWDVLSQDLIENFESYHEAFYNSRKFYGPSLHFHLRALQAINEEKIEMTYALLVSWGMHRMGKGGAKMKDFSHYSNSILECLDLIDKMKSKRLENIKVFEFDDIVNIFNKIDAMESSKKLVANSKVLAHYLPNLIAPIDRQHTLKYVGFKNYIGNYSESDVFKIIHLNLYKTVTEDQNFRKKAKMCIDNAKFKWDTSFPKIIDNILIGKMIQSKT